MSKAIFLHSMFRAGSTYMFNKFRTSDNTWPYYEPLHHDIGRLKASNLDIWKYNKKATQVMNHPELDKPHFYEYKDTFDETGSIPFYGTDLAYDRYASPPQELYSYIDHLISSAPKDMVPILQFNRTSLRIRHLKEHFPLGLHVFLLRNPINQFESYLHRGAIGKNIFLAINVLIILNNRDELFSGVLSNTDDIKGQNIYESLNIAMELSKSLTMKEHYSLFLHIWFKSLINAIEYSDFLLDMDKISSSMSYASKVEKVFSDYDLNTSIDFEDYGLRKYDKYSMPLNDYATETRLVYEIYASEFDSINSSFTYYYIDSVLAAASKVSTSRWFEKVAKTLRFS